MQRGNEYAQSRANESRENQITKRDRDKLRVRVRESELDRQLKCSCLIDDLTLWKSSRNCTYGEITFDFVHPVDDVTENL